MLFVVLLFAVLAMCHGSTREDFVAQVNQRRVQKGEAALQISAALMAVGEEHMANYQWAQDNGQYEYDTDGCGAPYSWYDEGTTQDWRPCCYSDDDDCTTVKAIQITCDWEKPFYSLISTAIHAFSGHTYDEAVPKFLDAFEDYISHSSWKSIGCDYNGNISPQIYICYFASKEDENTYVAPSY